MKDAPRQLGYVLIALLVCTASARAMSPMGIVRIPWIDLAAHPERQVTVDRAAEGGFGPPSTAVLEDGVTLVAAYPQGRTGPGIVVKRSRDGGRKWDGRVTVPGDFAGRHGLPVLHRIGARLIMMVPQPSMMQSESTDGGRTWRPLAPIFDREMSRERGYSSSVGPMSLVPIKGDRLLALYHDRNAGGDPRAIGLLRITSTDAGRTWSSPEPVGRHPRYPGAKALEPCVVRSPDGKTLLCIARTDLTLNSLIMTSDDEGATWTDMRETTRSRTGHRHAMKYAPDGRLVMTFRDTDSDSPTYGDLLAWVGTFDDVVNGREGQYRARLVDNVGRIIESGYSGLEVLGDGTLVVTTFAVLTPGDSPVITSVRFRMSDLDALAPKPGYSLPIVDLAGETLRQTIVDREPGQYLGHPTTVLLEDGRTMIAVYPKGHGRGGIVMKRSTDAGQTWSDRLPVPENWATSKEVPTIHRTIDPTTGARRLILFSGLYPIRMSVSEDDGTTWTPLAPIGDYGGIVAMGCVERVGRGNYMALFHDDGRFIRNGGVAGEEMTVYKIMSRDGGLTWSEPEPILTRQHVHLCEPGLIRSPDGKEIAILMRENRRRLNSFVMFSRDGGQTFFGLRELPAALTGDRHTARYAPDGRLFISFRDTARESATQGDWVGWVGTYEDIRRGAEGQYRIRLMDNHHEWDCAYPGVEVLGDGTFVATTYGHWTEGEEPYIVSVRFDLAEIDERAARN